MSVNAELSGMKELIDRISNMGNGANKAVNKALKAGGEVLLAEQQAKVPVRTGKTKAALKISGARTKKGIKSIWVGDVDSLRGKIPYYLEYGTSKTRARPFMRPAYNAKKEDIKRAIAETIREGLGL